MKLHSTENILEVAVHSFQSAQAAVSGGADRIELCTALQTGGLTPDLGLAKLVLESTNLPVNVLIRPRLGNFIYDKSEFKTIIRSIELCALLNVHGVVVGSLLPDGSIDREQIRDMKDAAGSLDITFHRAIDVCKNIYRSLDSLLEFGYNRVLSSGGAVTAWEGKHTLRKMVEHVKDAGLIVMPGAGVTASNAASILSETGAVEIHASAKTETPLPANDAIGLTYVNGKPITTKWESDAKKIEEIKTAIVEMKI